MSNLPLLASQRAPVPASLDRRLAKRAKFRSFRIKLSHASPPLARLYVASRAIVKFSIFYGEKAQK
jgi:hypothetical protein